MFNTDSGTLTMYQIVGFIGLSVLMVKSHL